MKIKTNLKPEQLQLIAKGLTKLAGEDKIPPLANQAETDLMNAVSSLFSDMTLSLQQDLSKIFKEQQYG